jgi:pyridoxal phosphate enzyme (YggS family)
MPEQDHTLKSRYQNTLDLVNECALKYQRDPLSINLIAVSKRHSADKVVNLAKLGHSEFAENYVQEGVEKISRVTESLDALGVEKACTWHFIGHIQSRKCRDIAASFDWVHTIDSSKVANKLNLHRTGQPPLNALIQVNLQREASKSGVSVEELAELAALVRELPNLHFRGLMIIPEIEKDFEKQRAVFRRCRMALEQLNLQGYSLDQLSMGMTQDMEAAIAEGATQIRIGTAIFGPRPIQER